MSWAVGEHEGRDIGYGVPGWCDHPGCWHEIDRGISFVCGSEAYGGDLGCGLYFCHEHLEIAPRGRGDNRRYPALCSRCRRNRDPFTPTPDHPDWIRHKWTHPSWAEWRADQIQASDGMIECSVDAAYQVCRELVGRQQYFAVAARATDAMPGNSFYSAVFMEVVRLARSVLAGMEEEPTELSEADVDRLMVDLPGCEVSRADPGPAAVRAPGS